MYVLGTAGHVDHGKSTLVLALTGIDPDRLPEEKSRQMTIDLGFAWLKLPSGREVSMIDVPGHERFIKNMLAGVGGMDLALLVIAADEGVMPQTKEHLAILDLLNLKGGIVVITKKDLVDEETQELAILEAGEIIQGTALEGAPIVVTSAVTRDGFPELLATIDRLLDSIPPRRDINRPRLSIDRVFSMKGFGTIVTGTLTDGKLFLDQQVEILPTGQRAHIRGLQTHKRQIDTALPGSRVAINLAGISAEELKRGFVITTAGWLKPTHLVDVKLRAVSGLDSPVVHNTPVTFHTGACEVPGKLRLLEKERLNPGETGWGQIRLEQPVAVAKGDLFILRSFERTIGGGEIIDPYAKRHPRLSASVIKSLLARGNSSPEDSVLAILKDNEPILVGQLSRLASLSLNETATLLEKLASAGRVVKLGETAGGALFFSADGWNALKDKTRQFIQEYHHQFPLRKGMSKEELRSRLKTPAPYYDSILQKLVDEGIIIKDGMLVKLPTHEIKLSAEQQSAVDAFLKSLSQNPYYPSREIVPDPEILNMLINDGRIIKLKDEIIFLTSAYHEMVEGIIQRLRLKKEITIAEVRDMFKTSRKNAQVLLEYLDAQQITRRVGDVHVLHLKASFCRQGNEAKGDAYLDKATIK